MALDVGTLRAIFTGDAARYFDTSTKVKRDAKDVDGTKATVTVDGDDSPLAKTLTASRAKLAEISRETAIMKVDADIGAAKAKIEAIEGRRDSIILDVDAKIDKAEARITKLESQRGKTTIDVDAEISKARDRIAVLTRQRSTTVVEAEASIAKAEGSIAALVARRRKIVLDAEADTGSAFQAGVAIGVAAKAGVVSAGIGSAFTVAAAGAVATAPALLGVGAAAGVAAGLVGALSGAVKAYSADQKAAESTAGGATASALSNSIAIRNAEQNIADARRHAAQAAADAARQVADAERAVAGAERDAERATRAVNDARAAAARQLEDLQDKVAGYALSEKDAALAVEEANKAKAEAEARYGKGSLEARRAALNVEQAEARLADVRKNGARDVADLTAANAAGVDGSKQVVAAKEAEQAANERVADANRALGVAQEQAGRQQEDAAIQVARAIQQLSDTQAQQAATAGDAAGKANTYAAELAKLTPEGRKFVETLIGMRDVAKRLGAEMQTATLPGFTRLIDAGRDLEPVLGHGIDMVGGAMSRTADKGAALAKSPAFQKDLWQAFDNAVPVLDAIGDATVDMTGDWIHFVAESRPAARGLADLIGGISGGIGDLFDNSTAGMDSYERILRSVGGIARDTLGEIGRLMANVSNASAPEIERLRELWRDFLRVVGDFATSYLPTLLGGFTTLLQVATNTIGPIAPLIGTIAGAVTPAMAALKLIDKVTFGGVTGQINNIKSKIGEADTARGRFANGLSGMVGAVFNPWTLAIGGAVAALTLLNDMQKDAAASVKQGSDGVKAYRDELARNNGVVGDATRALAEKNLTSIDAANSDRKLVEVAKDHGISLQDLTSAYEGNRTAQDKILGTLGQQTTAWWDVTGAIGDAGHQIGYWIGAADDGADSASTLQGQLRKLWGDVNKTAAGTGDMSYEQQLAKKTTADLEADIKKMGDSTGDAASRGEALIDFLQKLNGQSPTYEDAIQRINDRMRDLADLFGENIDRSKGWGQELLNSDGSVNTLTSNGSRLRDMLRDIANNTAGAAQAAYDLAISQGRSVPEAMAAANSVVSEQDRRLMLLAESMGLSSDAMQVLLNKYALTPEQVLSVIGQPGMENAQHQADVYGDKLDRLKNPVITTMDVWTQPAYDSVGRFLDWYYNLVSHPLPSPSVAPGGVLPLGDSGARRASGGPVEAGHMYLVGEEGPELFMSDNAGTIIPAGPTAAMLGDMGKPLPAAPAPQMALTGGGSAAQGGGGAASPVTSSMVELQIGAQLAPLTAEIRALTTAVANRPVVLEANGAQLARTNELGAIYNRRR